MGKHLKLGVFFFCLMAVWIWGIHGSLAKNPTQDLPTSNQPALDLPLKQARVLIEKSRRRLSLFAENKLLRVYPIGLGFAPKGTKELQGDGKTPEGQYFIVLKNTQSRFYLSLAIGYPGPTDAKRALASQQINRNQYRAINRAAKHKSPPPWDTALGGEIFIHGHGSGSDWTLGCIALDNPHMKELFEALPVGTPVLIQP